MLEQPFDADVVELEPCAPSESAAAPLLEMPFCRDAWLAREIGLLRTMFFSGATIAEISEEVGRPIHGVRDKIVTLGLRRSSTRPWGEFEDQLLLVRYGTLPAADLALMLGRSCSSVYARGALLGLTEGNPPPYSDWEDAQVRTGYVRGVKVSSIADLIGRTPQSVTSRASSLGLQHAAAPPDWSAQELGRMLELAYEGHRYLAIIDMLMTEGFPARTKAGLGPKLRKLGYSRGWGRRWTPEEDRLIREAYATGASLSPLKDRLGRSRTSIAWRTKELGLQGTHEKKAGWRTEPPWTEDAEQILRDNYGKMKTQALADLLGRSKMATLNRAWHLGLKHGYWRHYTADEKRAFQIAFRHGVSIADLAIAMDRHPMTVSKYATDKLGLNFGRRERLKPPLTIAEILAFENPASEVDRSPPAATPLQSRRQPRHERVIDRRVRPRIRALRARGLA